MLLKVAYGKEIHLYNGELTLSGVKSFTRRVFRKLPEHFSFFYFDQQGDRITVSTPEDLNTLNPTHNCRIKKIFIEEDQKFELLSVEEQPSLQEVAVQISNQDQICVDIAHNFLIEIGQNATEKACKAIQDEMYVDIARKFLVRIGENAMKKVVQEQIYVDVAREFLAQVSQSAICKVIEAEEKVTGELVKEYLAGLTSNIAQKVGEQQERSIQQRLTFKKTSKLVRMESINQKPTPKTEKISQSLQKIIDRKVEAKIKAILPKIVDRITKEVESRIHKTNCIKCDRKEISVQKLINRQLLKSYKPRTQRSLEMCRMENPEC